MHYTDNRRDIHAAYSISATMLEGIRDEHREKMLAHVTYSLTRVLRDEAEKTAMALKWERYVFAEVSPHEWPDMSPAAVRFKRFDHHPVFEARAHGYIFERLPEWPIREMKAEEQPSGSLSHPALRPVATLSGKSGLAVAGDGAIFFWPYT